jgi:hypothetical protein
MALSNQIAFMQQKPDFDRTQLRGLQKELEAGAYTRPLFSTT